MAVLVSSVLAVGSSCLDLSLLQVVGSLGSAACEVVPDTRRGDLPLRRVPPLPLYPQAIAPASLPVCDKLMFNGHFGKKPPGIKMPVEKGIEGYGNSHYQGPFYNPLNSTPTMWGSVASLWVIALKNGKRLCFLLSFPPLVRTAD